MRRIDWLILLIVVLAVFVRFTRLGNETLGAYIFGVHADRAALDLNSRMWGTVFGVLTQLANIAVAVWLFVVARKGKETAWVWFLGGLLYGPLVAILFFVLRCYDHLQQLTEKGET